MGQANSSSKVTKKIRAQYEENGQGHVFEYLDKGMLSAEEEAEFAKQLAEIDVKRALELFEGSMKAEKELEANGAAAITPIPRAEVASVAEAAVRDFVM